MFKSKLTIFLFVAVILSIAIGMQFIDKKDQQTPEIIKLIPEDASVIIETNQFPALIDKLNNRTVFSKVFKDIKVWKSFFNDINFLDSILLANNNIKNLLVDTKFLCSGHILAKNKLDFLYILALNSESKEDQFRSFMTKLVKDKAQIMQYEYEGNNVYELAFLNDNASNPTITYSFVNGSLIFSFSKILTETAIRRLQSPTSLLNDHAFVTLFKTAGKNVDANIYINYKYFKDKLSPIVNDNNFITSRNIDKFTSWSAFDLRLNKYNISLSGFSHADDSLSYFLNSFDEQDNLENDFLSVIPDNTIGFIALNISDFNLFHQHYIDYLKSIRKYKTVATKIEKLNRKLDLDIIEFINENLENSVCMVYLPNIEKKTKTAFFMSLKDPKTMQDFLKDAQQSMQVSTIKNFKPEVIDATQKIYARKFPLPNIFSLLFSNLFNPLSPKYYFIAKDYLIVAGSITDLQVIYKQINTQKTLRKNSDFAQYSNSISSKSNLFFYLDFTNAQTVLSKYLKPKPFNIFTKNLKKFNKLQALSCQFGKEDELFFTNLYLNYNPAFGQKTKNSWQINLDTLVLSTPQTVINHYTGEKEILVQDVENKIYLIDNKGKIFWKRSLPEKIMGKVHQIDFFKNNKLQLFFNTKNYLFLIDRNGKNVADYPIKFKSPTTNPISVFDYNGKKDYRIIVACENKSVYLLNKNAGKIEGWKFKQTESVVNLPIQHFTYKGKDYLIFADQNKTYILNRKGQPRIIPKVDFAKNSKTLFYFDKEKDEKTAFFVTSGKNNQLYFIFLDGTVKKMNFEDINPNHQFIYSSLSPKGKKQFIFANNNKLLVYNRNKNLLFDKKFDENIAHLQVFSKNNAKYIGVNLESGDKIYLFSGDGKLVQDFPLIGAAPFILEKPDRSENKYNITVPNRPDFLTNYTIFLKK